MQWNLTGFTHCTDKQCQADKGNGGNVPAQEREMCTTFNQCRNCSKYLGILNRTEVVPDSQNADGKTEVANTIDNKCLHRSDIRTLTFEPETDQQVGEQAYGFPAEEEGEEVITHHQNQHGEGKGGDIGEETGVAGVSVHITNGVNMHACRDDGNRHHHDGAQSVDHHADRHDEVVGDHPYPEITVERGTTQNLNKYMNREDR